MSKPVFAALLVGMSVFALARPASPASPTVEVKLFQFQPGTIEAKVGETVTWKNSDEIEHTVTSGEPEKKDGRFDMKLPGKGASSSFKFGEPGTYHYFCDRHPSMRGEVRVH